MTTEHPPLHELTLRQLRKLASAYGVSRYSRMLKAQLIIELQKIQNIQRPSSSSQMEGQETVETAKFDVGQTDRTGGSLAAVDAGLTDLPAGYGESRIVLMPRDPQWAYAYWDVSNEHKEKLRHQGGSRLALRFYDVTNINLEYQRPPSLQQYECDELAREWYLPVPVSDRDYVVEIGYVCADGHWLLLARSASVRIPPVYPFDGIEDQFITIDWDEDLRGKTFVELMPTRRMEIAPPIYEEGFGVPGSLFGSRQMVSEQAISSYVFPSGMGMGSGIGIMMSGIGMSGIGFAASMPPLRPRQFWLVADAELIVYGATEPDATVTIGGCPVKLNPDGTFRLQMSFQDGDIDFPIMAVAADGEQMRSIHMKFTRETPHRNTNAKGETAEELFLTGSASLPPKDWFKRFRVELEKISLSEFNSQVIKEFELLDTWLKIQNVQFSLDLRFEEEKHNKALERVKSLIENNLVLRTVIPLKLLFLQLIKRVSIDEFHVREIIEAIVKPVLSTVAQSNLYHPDDEPSKVLEEAKVDIAILTKLIISEDKEVPTGIPSAAIQEPDIVICDSPGDVMYRIPRTGPRMNEYTED